MYSIHSVEDFLSFTRGEELLHRCRLGERGTVWLQPKDMDIGGGRMTLEEIDQLRDHPDAQVLAVSGLDQEGFEYLITNYGRQFRVLHFFKNKKVEDWSLLGTLPQLEYLFYFFNQRIQKFWDMRNNTSLKAIVIKDFSRLKTLDGIQNAKNLEYFLLGNAVWDTAEVDSYQYFAHTGVRYLAFTGRKILDPSVEYLAHMPRLEAFHGLLYRSSIEQAAWVKANAAPTLKLQPQLRSWGKTPEETVTDVHFPWKQRSYTLEGKQARYARDLAKFETLTAQYRGVPYEQAFPRENTP